MLRAASAGVEAWPASVGRRSPDEFPAPTQSPQAHLDEECKGRHACRDNREVGPVAGLHYDGSSRIERGLILPSADTLRRLATVLGLPELRNHPCRDTDAPRFFGTKNVPRCYNVSALEEMLGTDDKDALAVQLKVSTRTIDRLRAKGALTEAEADVYAVRAGFHPGTVWPNWWEFSGE